MPEEISMYVTSMKDELEEVESDQFIGLDSYKDSGFERNPERQALYLDGLAKRLLDYASVYRKI